MTRRIRTAFVQRSTDSRFVPYTHRFVCFSFVFDLAHTRARFSVDLPLDGIFIGDCWW